MNAQNSTQSNNTLKSHSHGWLLFNDDYDTETPEYEAVVYTDNYGAYHVGTYHQDVGQVTYYGPFISEELAEQFLIDNDFQDYSG